MSETGVSALEHSIQETDIWLKAIQKELHLENRPHAYNALRAVLHALRDRLVPESAVHFGAQLPIVVRGIYYEGWHMSGKPTGERSVQEFADKVAKELPPKFAMDPLTVTRGVFAALSKEMDEGAMAKVVQQMPEPLRQLWP
ncbi:DUF2267 domain-containing protein [Afifella pfennigii]|uniref:DUF2267 domain-containing protein n=1 Tax=Afifella pfennigii TaxID=209897 RepID=UPI00047A7AF8|nr:DUF2267 domain-containing protein [Afifella pfennigii]